MWSLGITLAQLVACDVHAPYGAGTGVANIVLQVHMRARMCLYLSGHKCMCTCVTMCALPDTHAWAKGTPPRHNSALCRCVWA